MKLNANTVRKLEEAFAIGADVSAACYFANISRPTYYTWEKENPELKEKFNRLKEKPVLKAYQTISDNLDDINTAKWYVGRKRRKEFGNSVDLTTGGDKININFDGSFKSFTTPPETEGNS